MGLNRTVERAMKILQLVSKSDRGLTLQELSIELDVPKSSVYVILQTLLTLGYITPHRFNEKRYCLGLKVFSLGMKYLEGQNIVEESAYYLNQLAEKYHKTGFVGILENDVIVYVHKYVGQGAVLASCALGSRHEVYATSLGKAALAFSDQETTDRIINKLELKSVTENTITSKENLLEELKLTRKRGYATDIKEHENKTLCYGVPIFDYKGNVIAAISLSDIVHPDEDREAIIKDLINCGKQISKAFGFTNPYYENEMTRYN
ncbi:MAG: IclR family transcriptional regulator [Pleomorphochaeta sp.]